MKSLENRMKDNYEHRSRIKLVRRMPVIMRLDGKAFHTFTRSCKKPFDESLRRAMCDTAHHLIEEIQGAKCAYVQSDEISILITDFDKLTTDAWFDYNIQKMTSISAALASVYFSFEYDKPAYFDSRVFNVPKEEVNNYFMWRQQDWVRNSLYMFANSFYSCKELHKKNSSDMHEMLYKKGENWAKLLDKWKNGSFIGKVLVEERMRPELFVLCPPFKEHPNIIDHYLKPLEV